MRDITSSYVIDFRCALDFGEGQAKAKSGGGKEEKRRSGEGHRTGSTVVGSEVPAVYTAVQVCGFWRLRVEESLGMERIPKLGLDFCQAVVVKRISPVNS